MSCYRTGNGFESRRGSTGSPGTSTRRIPSSTTVDQLFDNCNVAQKAGTVLMADAVNFMAPPVTRSAAWPSGEPGTARREPG